MTESDTPAIGQEPSPDGLPATSPAEGSIPPAEPTSQISQTGAGLGAAAAVAQRPGAGYVGQTKHDPDRPTIGRIVHYVLAKNGKHRPAIVTEVHGPTCVNLTMFPDSSDGHGNSAHETSVLQGLPGEDGNYPSHTWHWPERE